MHMDGGLVLWYLNPIVEAKWASVRGVLEIRELPHFHHSEMTRNNENRGTANNYNVHKTVHVDGC